MRIATSWARNVTSVDEMFAEIQRRFYTPIEAEALIPQCVTTENVADVVSAFGRKFNKNYVDRLKRFVHSIDLDVDRSGDQYNDLNFVVDGRITERFRVGIECLRRYFEEDTNGVG